MSSSGCSISGIMKFVVFFSLFAVAASFRIPFYSQLGKHWETYKKVYGKNYSPNEEVARRLIWEANVIDVINHNIDAYMGLNSYERGINAYSDMNHEEFLKKKTGLGHTTLFPRIQGSSWLPPSNIQTPQRVDWREQGLVTPVKNQKDCGSCWSFSATGALEGQHKKRTGKLVSLSEQNLVDCAKSEDIHGCDGGIMDAAFNYVVLNQGIDTEESYPYTAKEGICHFNKSNVGATCTGVMDIPSGDESALLMAVATIGPISAGIDASRDGFSSYRNGIYDDPKCGSQTNHAILIVGYGTEDGEDYWLIKNSWGDSWGINGYIKMARNKNNQCGIASMASYPLV